MCIFQLLMLSVCYLESQENKMKRKQDSLPSGPGWFHQPSGKGHSGSGYTNCPAFHLHFSSLPTGLREISLTACGSPGILPPTSEELWSRKRCALGKKHQNQEEGGARRLPSCAARGPSYHFRYLPWCCFHLWGHV